MTFGIRNVKIFKLIRQTHIFIFLLGKTLI